MHKTRGQLLATLTRNKSARIELRLPQEEKDIIMRAAKALGQDISSFIRSQMLPKAKETLMFDESWKHNEASVAHLLRILYEDEVKEVPKQRELLARTLNDENITHPFQSKANDN